MRGELAQMAITDPPYNVPIAGHVCGNGKVKHEEFAMASGEMSSTEFVEFLRAAFVPIHAACQDGAVTFFFMDCRHTPEILAAALLLFGPPRQMCVWVKDNAWMGTFHHSQHELVHVFRKCDAPHINNFELGQLAATGRTSGTTRASILSRATDTNCWRCTRPSSRLASSPMRCATAASTKD